jgi:hypothetical protein
MIKKANGPEETQLLKKISQDLTGIRHEFAMFTKNMKPQCEDEKRRRRERGR